MNGVDAVQAALYQLRKEDAEIRAESFAIPANIVARRPDGELWNGCATTVAAVSKPGSAQLVFFDPPFNIGDDYEGFDDKRDPADHSAIVWAMMAAAGHLVQPDGVVAWHIPEAMLWTVLDAARANGFTLWRQVVRAFAFGVFVDSKWINAHENLLLFTRPGARPIWQPENVLVDSTRLAMGDKRTGKSRWRGKRPPGTVWEYPRIQGNNGERWKGHPNQLPLRYLMRLVLAHTKEGGTVFDGCAGSGGLWTVCSATGRFYIGAEIVDKTARSAVRRRDSFEQAEIALKIREEFENAAKIPGADDGGGSSV